MSRYRLYSYRHPILWACIGAAIALVAVYSCCLFDRLFHRWALSPTEKVIQHKMALEGKSYNTLTFDLVDPNSAPEEIRETVLRGYRIIVDTQKEAKNYAGDRLNCTNCHFAGGITTGGRGGGISLAGVSARYPTYDKRSDAVITLPDRINMCFQRSMNGRPLPYDSDEMLALTTYFHWISRNFPTGVRAPWLGMKYITPSRKPNVERGKVMYEARCALCQGEDGNGDAVIPPLWGPESFNDGAGMSKETVFATFILYNMPYISPDLSEDEALDITGYVLANPRPQYKE